MRLTTWVFILLLLSACSGSMQSRPVMGERSISPVKVTQDFSLIETTIVEWGGIIVETNNLEASTEIQVIAYPLKDNGQPNIDATPTGRFIAVNQGYLEPADYTQGRSITLSGTVTDIRQGKVGEADYNFPLIMPNELQLWPVQSSSDTKSRMHFGLGVGSGGSHGSIGIGFGL